MFGFTLSVVFFFQPPSSPSRPGNSCPEAEKDLTHYLDHQRSTFASLPTM